MDEIVKHLILPAIQFRYERLVKQYYEMLQKREIEDRNGALEIFKYMAKGKLTLRFHLDCKN